MSDQDSARGTTAGPLGAYAVERSRINDWVATLLELGEVILRHFQRSSYAEATKARPDLDVQRD